MTKDTYKIYSLSHGSAESIAVTLADEIERRFHTSSQEIDEEFEQESKKFRVTVTVEEIEEWIDYEYW